MAKITREFSLDPGQPDNLIVEVHASSITGKMTEMFIFYKGKQVAHSQSNTEIRTGITVDLPDKGTLKAQVERKSFGGDQIAVTLNGKLLERSKSNPKDVTKVAGQVLYFIGGLGIFIGIVADVLEVETLQNAGLGWETALGSVIYLMLGWGVMIPSWIGFIALIVAIVLYIGDTIFFVKALASIGGAAGGAGIGFRVTVAFLLLAALPASWRLSQMREEERLAL